MICKQEIYNIFPGLTSDVVYERPSSGVNQHVTTLSNMAVEGTIRMCKQNIAMLCTMLGHSTQKEGSLGFILKVTLIYLSLN